MTGPTTTEVDPAISSEYLPALGPHGLAAPRPRPGPHVDARLAGSRMPAEWEPHERTLLAWPTRAALWQGAFDEAKRDYAAVARAVADHEPVTVIGLPGTRQEIWDLCGRANVDVFEAPVDDSWIRDNGPLIVCDSVGGRLGVDFAFNSWGRKFVPYDDDAALAARVLKHLGIERVPVDMVLEGGAISVDGEGSLLTTGQCVLHSNRNPDLSEADIVNTLCRALGVSRVLMLPFGHLDDRHTDGHVDGVCTYTSPGRVIAQTSSDPRNVNHEAMARNLRYLRDQRDASGRSIEVTGLDLWSAFEVEGIRDYVAYANFYVANGVVVAPVSGHPPDDERALASLVEHFPDRVVSAVPGRTLAFGGGGPHCITMQVPAAVGG